MFEDYIMITDAALRVVVTPSHSSYFAGEPPSAAIIIANTRSPQAPQVMPPLHPLHLPHPPHPLRPPCPRGHILCERRHFAEFVLFWKCSRLVQLIRSGHINHINTSGSVLPSFTGKDKDPNSRLIEQYDRHWGERDGITEDVTNT